MYTVDISERMPRKLFSSCSLGESSFTCLCVIINMFLICLHVLFICFWLCWFSIAVWTLSDGSKWELLSSWLWEAFSLWRPLPLWAQALGHRLNSCDARAPLLHGMWDPSGSEIEPMSPALAGRLFITRGSVICITFIVEKNRLTEMCNAR